ncbi:MAG: TonB-dependent receptor [Luteitalea sp.]|nr:TonB-dependent receptor [Luteitalea sp.]
MLRLVSLVLVCGVMSAGSGWAAVGGANQGPSRDAPPSAQEKPAEPPSQQAPDEASQEASEKLPINEEQVVVTASRTEQSLLNAPATVSVITSQTIEQSPALNYGDLFRTVPGLNVTQTSARDINLTSRAASGTLSASQLALVDGRSIYLDFFGFIMWDSLPVEPSDIKQIEVIRGPASAVWGANAMTGVVNVITKSPREMQGTRATIGVGTFGRSTDLVDQDAGSLFYVNGSHAQAVNDRWAYKISAGGYAQEAFARPTGLMPNETNTPYPSFPNSGTTQPKLDVRADYDFPDDERSLVFQGGVASSDGIIHTGIGPFDVVRGGTLGYGKVGFTRGGLKVSGFVNLLDGGATNLLSVGPDARPIEFDFKTETYDVEVGNVQTLAARHVLSYGGNFRRNQFQLSIAPGEDSRTEGGIYVQDEILLSRHFWWVVGARLDMFDVLDDPVFSPRTTFMYKPTPEQTVRVSYNRAYRAPSLINNFIDLTLLDQLPLGSLDPRLGGQVFNFPVTATGNTDLEEQSLDAYEVGYTGVLWDRATLSAAFYVNNVKNDIFFTQVDSYRASNPPPGWPLPPDVLELIVASGQFGPGNGLPAAFSYLNLGEVRYRGVELGIEGAVTRTWNGFLNYSYQDEPDPKDFDISELNLPPSHRMNVGVGYDGPRFLGNFTVSYTDDAFWRDVLDSRFDGPTDAFTLVNGAFGVKWGGRGEYITSVKVTNLLNNEIQQHVFGDIIKRQIVAELRTSF